MQSEQQLLRNGEGDLVLVGPRVELCEERGELVVRRFLPEQVGACAPVQGILEVLRAELGEEALQLVVGSDAGERAPLEAGPGVEQPR